MYPEAAVRASASAVCPRSQRSSRLDVEREGPPRRGHAGADRHRVDALDQEPGVDVLAERAEAEQGERAAVAPGAARRSSRAWAFIHSSGVRWAEAVAESDT
jgi:hypothetical protein